MKTPNPKCKYDNDGERITAPGKFEGEPIFAPALWDLALEGVADSDDGQTFGFNVPKQDTLRSEWPTLGAWLGRKRTIKLSEDSQGFVHCY